MVQKREIPLTFMYVYDDEAEAWAALAKEIFVASCGDSLEDARYMIRDAVSLTATVQIEDGRDGPLGQPTEADYLKEYFSGEGVVTERETLLLTIETEPALKVTSVDFASGYIMPSDVPFEDETTAPQSEDDRPMPAATVACIFRSAGISEAEAQAFLEGEVH